MASPNLVSMKEIDESSTKRKATAQPLFVAIVGCFGGATSTGKTNLSPPLSTKASEFAENGVKLSEIPTEKKKIFCLRPQL